MLRAQPLSPRHVQCALVCIRVAGAYLAMVVNQSWAAATHRPLNPYTRLPVRSKAESRRGQPPSVLLGPGRDGTKIVISELRQRAVQQAPTPYPRPTQGSESAIADSTSMPQRSSSRSTEEVDTFSSSAEAREAANDADYADYAVPSANA